MPLIINQGIQDTSKDLGNFPIIVEDNVKLQIIELTLSKFLANTLVVKFRILTGNHKNQIISDTSICYEEKSPMSWKYRSLRSCAGVPYKEGEPSNIDIEKLLLNKVVLADLSARAGTAKDGTVKDYQQFKYKKNKVEATEQPATPKSTIEDVVLDVETLSDDDLPFKEADVSVAQSSPAVKSTENYDEADWD